MSKDIEIEKVKEVEKMVDGEGKETMIERNTERIVEHIARGGMVGRVEVCAKSRWNNTGAMRRDINDMVEQCEDWIDKEREDIEGGLVRWDHRDDYLRVISALTKASLALQVAGHQI